MHATFFADGALNKKMHIFPTNFANSRVRQNGQKWLSEGTKGRQEGPTVTKVAFLRPLGGPKLHFFDAKS